MSVDWCVNAPAEDSPLTAIMPKLFPAQFLSSSVGLALVFVCDSPTQAAVLCGWCAGESKLRNGFERMSVNTSQI